MNEPMLASDQDIETFETAVIDAILRGERVQASTRVLEWLDDPQVDAPPRDRARIARLLWSPELFITGDPAAESHFILRVLEETAAAGQPAWLALAAENGFERTQQALTSTDDELLIAEQLAYAPRATSWHLLGVATLERIGMYEVERSRIAERLLHGLGETEAAYRVERARKRITRAPQPDPLGAMTNPTAAHTGQRIVLAGGHPALRSAVARHIEGRDGRVREIPSKFEAVRRDRQISQLVASSDLAIIIIRQIAHSTSDQVKRAAIRTGVPWRPALSPSVAGILAAIDASDER